MTFWGLERRPALVRQRRGLDSEPLFMSRRSACQWIANIVFIAIERRRDRRPHQREVRQRPPLARKRSPQSGTVRPERPDRDRYRLPRRRDVELVPQAHRQERRDEEGLLTRLPHRPAGGHRRQHIAVAAAERVVDFVDQRLERAVPAEAEVDAERIEVVSERARHAEQADRADLLLHAAPARRASRLLPQAPGASVAVVAIVEAEEIEPVVGEKAKPPVERVQFIQVDEQPEQPVAESVRRRPEPAMEHRAEIESRGGAHAARSSAGDRGHDAAVTMRDDSFATRHGRRTPPSCSATASPACSPSSWKPAPKCAPQNQTPPSP